MSESRRPLDVKRGVQRRTRSAGGGGIRLLTRWGDCCGVGFSAAVRRAGAPRESVSPGVSDPVRQRDACRSDQRGGGGGWQLDAERVRAAGEVVSRRRGQGSDGCPARSGSSYDPGRSGSDALRVIRSGSYDPGHTLRVIQSSSVDPGHMMARKRRREGRRGGFPIAENRKSAVHASDPILAGRQFRCGTGGGASIGIQSDCGHGHGSARAGPARRLLGVPVCGALPHGGNAARSHGSTTATRGQRGLISPFPHGVKGSGASQRWPGSGPRRVCRGRPRRAGRRRRAEAPAKGPKGIIRSQPPTGTRR